MGIKYKFKSFIKFMLNELLWCSLFALLIGLLAYVC
jgi:hypothetical protein